MKHHALMGFIVFLVAASLALLPVQLARAGTGKGVGNYHAVTPNNTVCLTVDDGYGRQNQRRILDTLRKYHVKCTFFITGDALLRKPNLWPQAVKDGHEICYHTMYHKNLKKMSNGQIQRDIAQWNAALAKALPGYQSPKLARFPGGHGADDPRVMGIFKQNGYTVIGWSLQAVNEKSIPWRMKNKTQRNSIILIHFDPVHAKALPQYLGYLKKKFKLSLVSDAFPASKPKPPPTPAPSPTPVPSPSVSPIADQYGCYTNYQIE